MGRLMDEILSNTPDEGLDIKSAPDEVKIAYTALRVAFGFEDPIEDLIWFGKDIASENKSFNGYTNYAKHLNAFLDRISITLREKNRSLLSHLAYSAKLIELYSMARAYDESEEVRDAVRVIEGDARVPRDVRDLMRRIMDSETREMLYDLVDSVILKPLEKLGKREKLEEVTERLNKLVGYATVCLASYGELLSGKLEKELNIGAIGVLYDHLKLEARSGNIIDFGFEILYFKNKKKNDYTMLGDDWAYQVKSLYNVAKELMGLCAETLEKYVNTKQAVSTP